MASKEGCAFVLRVEYLAQPRRRFGVERVERFRRQDMDERRLLGIPQQLFQVLLILRSRVSHIRPRKAAPSSSDIETGRRDRPETRFSRRFRDKELSCDRARFSSFQREIDDQGRRRDKTTGQVVEIGLLPERKFSVGIMSIETVFSLQEYDMPGSVNLGGSDFLHELLD